MLSACRMSADAKEKKPGRRQGPLFRVRPILEVLEDRSLLSTVNTWTAPGSFGNRNTGATGR
jgi:hypothetical protein